MKSLDDIQTDMSALFEELKAGDVLEVLPPTGRFYTQLQPNQKKNYVAFVAGSGITPLLSIIKTTLATEPASTYQSRATSYASKAFLNAHLHALATVNARTPPAASISARARWLIRSLPSMNQRKVWVSSSRFIPCTARSRQAAR